MDLQPESVDRPVAASLKATYRALLARGLEAGEAANLTAFLHGLPSAGFRWTLPEVEAIVHRRLAHAAEQRASAAAVGTARAPTPASGGRPPVAGPLGPAPRTSSIRRPPDPRRPPECLQRARISSPLLANAERAPNSSGRLLLRPAGLAHAGVARSAPSLTHLEVRSRRVLAPAGRAVRPGKGSCPGRIWRSRFGTIRGPWRRPTSERAIGTAGHRLPDRLRAGRRRRDLPGRDALDRARRADRRHQPHRREVRDPGRRVPAGRRGPVAARRRPSRRSWIPASGPTGARSRCYGAGRRPRRAGQRAAAAGGAAGSAA